MIKNQTKIKAKLLALLVELENLSTTAQENRKPIHLDQQAVGRLSRMDSLQIQAMDMAQERARQKQIARLHSALKRLDTGEYGYCAKCDLAISPQRLHIDPAALLCVNCAV